jgi:WD40 repeat protein
VVFRHKSSPIPEYKSGELVLWDVDSGREVKKLDGMPWPIGLAVSPDGRWLTMLNQREGDETYSQHELSVRDAETWQPVLTRKDLPVYGRYAVFASDSKSIVVGVKDSVAVLEIPSGLERKSYGGLSSSALAVAVSPDGRWVAATPSPCLG